MVLLSQLFVQPTLDKNSGCRLSSVIAHQGLCRNLIALFKHHWTLDLERKTKDKKYIACRAGLVFLRSRSDLFTLFNCPGRRLVQVIQISLLLPTIISLTNSWFVHMISVIFSNLRVSAIQGGLFPVWIDVSHTSLDKKW